ncbi:hypothetical protein BPT24_094 [Tenacibaculum phage pT24]|uniref:Uncharacterized protein n=1 Tax=Tenacibaculum phage pT24 TaxID=1880590 RepID=A0A1B4XWQ1_9CAUD|nr:hypothetical protein HYP10_gp094 [Tenacibaculum phage pT24]BAV39219.1 hypothetical protein BPT24_094 [Tenacibaculum phage pT24]
MENIHKIELVVYIYYNDENEIEVCTIDGEVLGIFSEIQVHHFLRAVKRGNKNHYTFEDNINNSDRLLWSVSKKRLNDMINVNR